MNQNSNTLEWTDAQKLGAETGRTVCEVQAEHETATLPSEEKSKGLVKAESDVAKAERELAAAEARRARHTEETQQFWNKKSIGPKLQKRIDTLTCHIADSEYNIVQLRARFTEHAGTVDLLHEVIIELDSIARFELAVKALPAARDGIQKALDQNNAEVDELAKKLGIAI